MLSVSTWYLVSSTSTSSLVTERASTQVTESAESSSSSFSTNLPFSCCQYVIISDLRKQKWDYHSINPLFVLAMPPGPGRRNNASLLKLTR